MWTTLRSQTIHKSQWFRATQNAPQEWNQLGFSRDGEDPELNVFLAPLAPAQIQDQQNRNDTPSSTRLIIDRMILDLGKWSFYTSFLSLITKEPTPTWWEALEGSRQGPSGIQYVIITYDLSAWWYSNPSCINQRHSKCVSNINSIISYLSCDLEYKSPARPQAQDQTFRVAASARLPSSPEVESNIKPSNQDHRS